MILYVISYDEGGLQKFPDRKREIVEIAKPPEKTIKTIGGVRLYEPKMSHM